MAYARGRFGIEYQPVNRPEHPSWLPTVLGLVFFALVVSLAVTLYRRVRRVVTAAETETAVVAVVEEKAIAVAPVPEAKAPPPPPKERVAIGDNRPAKVRNLLMRLREAEAGGDIEKQVSVIEQLRSLPGNLVADQDDKLAKRLGALNLKLLFETKSPRWCTEVVVRRGDNATRIAAAHGSTLASLAQLNGDVNVLREGRRLRVMNHPKFSLAVYRLSKTADLSLNDKFFKRYYLPVAPTGAVGSYETVARIRTTLAQTGVTLDARDRAELEKLLPAGTPVILSEFR